MPVRFIPNDQICDAAVDFLKEYHPSDSIPVPIEEIIEFQFGMDIIPTPDLQKRFGIEGALAGDFSGIYVDDFVQTARINRYRFTLAHEIGHYILHKEFLSTMGGFSSIDEWIEQLRSISGRDRDNMEYQGYAFAGYVLVPRQHLKREFIKVLPGIDTLLRQAKDAGFKRPAYIDLAVDHLSNKLAGIFEVSPEVISKRIKNDELESHIR